MRIVRAKCECPINQGQLVNEDGSALDPAVEAKAMTLMQGVQEDKVLGKMHLNDVAAVRIAESVMKRFNLTHKSE